MVKIKYLILIMQLLVLKQIILSQELGIFNNPEVFPTYSNSKNPEKCLILFLAQNVKYPETAMRDTIRGSVYIKYWIEEDGTTSNQEIIKGIREDFDNEAMRVAKMIKYFAPAMNRGKPIRFESYIRISFDYKDDKGKKWGKKQKKNKTDYL